jgi:hypothetical protein
MIDEGEIAEHDAGLLPPHSSSGTAGEQDRGPVRIERANLIRSISGQGR